MPERHRPQEPRRDLPRLGFGLGLRPEYYPDILDGDPPVDWFEAISENYMVDGGPPLRKLDQVAERWPVVLHGVSLSIGGSDPLDFEYLARLKALARRAKPAWVSDHLCWSRHNGTHLHDLLPIPFNDETLRHVASRVRQVQDFLGRRILLENVSSYIEWRSSTMAEWKFLARLSEEADCLLLLDVNNVYVSARNHGFAAEDFLNGLPVGRVAQMHLAGHSDTGAFIIDTHDAPITDPVFALYRKAVQRFGPVPSMIERDDNFPPFAELLDELARVRREAAAALAVPA
ncbi:MAG TPA: DUF692 domain-containing protein [Ferrovibrio sp.]|uniref:MNIO family bufferin maturase n=1 Tax=Ferrovibrio sp. TaxID=1917215 RepID=UPI002ED1D3C8